MSISRDHTGSLTTKGADVMASQSVQPQFGQPEFGQPELGTADSNADRFEVGQATAEYALVLLGAAAVALLLIGWATTTDQVSRLFDFVVDQVIGRSG
jgi:hypothetical protein